METTAFLYMDSKLNWTSSFYKLNFLLFNVGTIIEMDADSVCSWPQFKLLLFLHVLHVVQTKVNTKDGSQTLTSGEKERGKNAYTITLVSGE